MSNRLKELDWQVSSDPFSDVSTQSDPLNDLLIGEEEVRYQLTDRPVIGRWVRGGFQAPRRHIENRQIDEVSAALRVWLAMHEDALESASETELIDFFTTQSLAVVKAEEVGRTRRPSESSRLTHDILRRVSVAVLLGVTATQFIYLVTGVTILHPIAAVACSVTALSFLLMSRMMKSELARVFRDASSSSP